MVSVLPMASDIAFVFPGQGSQEVGMGRALAEAFSEARDVFEAADDALGEPISKLCFEGPDEALSRTANTQPAILTVSVAAHAVLRKRLGWTPALVAGHSLGEYSALVAAGSLSLADAVRVVRARGTSMQEAVPPGVGAMAAVLGLTADQVAEACREAAGDEVVSAANFNEPAQTVIAGHAGAVERASVRLRAAGARRVVPLPVSAPFHCELMAPVVARLRTVLEPVVLTVPQAPVVTNVEATPNSDPQRLKALLLAQVTGSVRWVECVRAMEAHGVRKVIELGPGKVLCGLIKRITKSLECFNVEDPQSLDKTLAALGGAHG
jgi:[acyl-carrier-protein] S-malonyltransferase